MVRRALNREVLAGVPGAHAAAQPPVCPMAPLVGVKVIILHVPMQVSPEPFLHLMPVPLSFGAEVQVPWLPPSNAAKDQPFRLSIISTKRVKR
jgi:hypothetical protein